MLESLGAHYSSISRACRFVLFFFLWGAKRSDDPFCVPGCEAMFFLGRLINCRIFFSLGWEFINRTAQASFVSAFLCFGSFMRGSDDLQCGNQRMWAGVKMAKVIGSVGLHERFSTCLAPVSCRLSQPSFPTDPAIRKSGFYIIPQQTLLRLRHSPTICWVWGCDFHFNHFKIIESWSPKQQESIPWWFPLLQPPGFTLCC